MLCRWHTKIVDRNLGVVCTDVLLLYPFAPPGSAEHVEQLQQDGQAASSFKGTVQLPRAPCCHVVCQRHEGAAWECLLTFAVAPELKDVVHKPLPDPLEGLVWPDSPQVCFCVWLPPLAGRSAWQRLGNMVWSWAVAL
jgi:hypothetical protein